MPGEKNQIFKASALVKSSATTKTNVVITASASASANSQQSYNDALNKATASAKKIADGIVSNDVTLINQTVDIVDSQFIQPLEKQIETLENEVQPLENEVKTLENEVKTLENEIEPLQEFENSVVYSNNIRLDQVVASLDAFKKAIYNVNYLTNLVNTNSEAIIKADRYDTVLKPIVEKEYYNNTDDFWTNSVTDYKCYFIWEKYQIMSNLTLDEQIEVFNKNGMPEYDELLNADWALQKKFLKEIIEKNPNQNIFTYLYVRKWINELKFYYYLYQKDVLRPNNWIFIGSGVDLEKYLPNTDNVDLFSPEYLKFINDLSSQIAVLNGDDWKVDAIWPYINPAKIDSATCLYSSEYPSWTGLPINECFIPGSNTDTPAIITNIINDLYFNYPNLIPGNIAISTYNIGDIYYVSLLKIDTYNGILCFKQKEININSYFQNPLIINNDTIINGSLNVKTYDGEDIIKTDNVSKITSFHNKIGVNQDTYNVKGLIDVDNLSNNNILNIMNDFVDPSLYSYEVTNDIKDSIHYGDTSVSVPPTYQSNVFIFKTPLLNAIQSTDIQFLYTPSNTNTGVFTSKKMDNTSFTKIQTIVNEVNKMLPQFTTNKVINLDNTIEDYTFSFVELLNDTNYYYLCSLRGVIKTNPVNSLENEVYFICSFLDVNSFMINPNYVTYMNNVTGNLSSCSRLLNLSNLIILNPDVQANLFKGQSISSSTDPNSPYFSDQINNSVYFRNRFERKDAYVWANEYLTNEEIKNGTIYSTLFNELFTYYNMKKSNEIFQPNTDNSVTNIINTMMSNYNNNFGENKQIMTFFINYDWIKGRKNSIVNIIPIQGKYYLIGSGFNLSDVLDETIIAKGDNVITGNLTILDDKTNVPVFTVNREQKITSSVYHTGIGTTNPTTMLDINDCGVKDINDIIKSMASQYNLINYNLNNFINALQKSQADAVEFIETNFIDPNTGKELTQSINNYLYFYKIPNDLNSKEHLILYNWLYPNWNNYTIDYLLKNNVNDQQAIQFNNNIINDIYKSFNFFNKSQLMVIFPWVTGIKVTNSRTVNINNNFYNIGMGVNLQNYVTYESNDNIQKFFTCLQSYTYQLQDIVIRYNKIPSSNILNEQKATDVRYQAAQVYPIQKLVQYTIDFNDISTMTISNLDYDTFQISNTQIYSNITDLNLRTKLLFFFNNSKVQYTSINLNDYGVINFEDKYNEFVSLFWCSNVSTNNLITLISLELQIDSIVIPSLNLKGDMKVYGDAYFTNSPNDDDSNTYVYIDTRNKFMGINSLETSINYNTQIGNISLSKYNLANQNVIISSDVYPNLVGERNAANEQTKNEEGEVVPNLPYFVPLAPLSLRRISNYYDFGDMLKYSKQYTTPIDPKLNLTTMTGKSTPENPQYTTYHYGSSIAYEIRDKNGYSNVLGRNYMGLDDVVNGNPRAGFGIQVIDNDNDYSYRNIMYVDNQSTLSVNAIKLGGNNVLSVDEEGNLLFNGKKVNLT